MNLIYCILQVNDTSICVRESMYRKFIREYIDDQGICRIDYILDNDFVAPRLKQIISKEEYYSILESEAHEYQDELLANLVNELRNRRTMIKKSKRLISNTSKFLINNI